MRILGAPGAPMSCGLKQPTACRKSAKGDFVAFGDQAMLRGRKVVRGFMKRRAFIATLGGAAACPVAVLAQKSALPRVAWIALAAAPEIATFRNAMLALGYVEVKSYVLE